MVGREQARGYVDGENGFLILISPENTVGTEFEVW